MTSQVSENFKQYYAAWRARICNVGSNLFIWDASEGQILHCNLKTLSSQHLPSEECQQASKPRLGGSGSNANSSSPSISNIGNADSKDDTPQFQKLLLCDRLSMEVEGISPNETGNFLVVWGAHGIRVVELPRRWGKNVMFEGGKESVSCRTIPVGEHIFSGHKSLRIRQVTWHPGSKTDSHLALLTSDNMFSVYDIQAPDEPLTIMNINTGDLSPAYSPSKTLVGPALGETSVAFDFGAAITVQPKQSSLLKSPKAEPVEVWPVYCVRGNGDVLLLYSHLSHFRQLKFPVQGPLAMNPPADDNYGVDACSIICLPTPFPVVVISTCEGRVHHCVQLPGSLEDQNRLSEVSSLYSCPIEPSLYVIETAELELCLSLPKFDGETTIDDDFMCPVRLKKDYSSPDRYHCAHAAGVHCVALPWLSVVQQYFLDESGDFNMPEEKECVVEHLVCTKPLNSCPTSPILGLDVVNDPLLGNTLLVLANDYNFTALPIGCQYQLVTNLSGSGSDLNKSLTQDKKPFSAQVQQILQKRTSNPLLMSANNTELSQQGCFQLLSRATQILREEYIQRQDHARQEIDRRISILKQLKQQHLSDMKQLSESRQSLKEHAHSIAEKLEACHENHEKLLKRVEAVLRKVQNRIPTLSEAERQMLKELKKIKENMQMYERHIEQVRMKQEVQDTKMTKTPRVGGPTLKKRQLLQIHDVLKEEGNDIEDLKKDIDRLNLAVT